MRRRKEKGEKEDGSTRFARRPTVHALFRLSCPCSLLFLLHACSCSTFDIRCLGYKHSATVQCARSPHEASSAYIQGRRCTARGIASRDMEYSIAVAVALVRGRRETASSMDTRGLVACRMLYMVYGICNAVAAVAPASTMGPAAYMHGALMNCCSLAPSLMVTRTRQAGAVCSTTAPQHHSTTAGRRVYYAHTDMRYALRDAEIGAAAVLLPAVPSLSGTAHPCASCAVLCFRLARRGHPVLQCCYASRFALTTVAVGTTEQEDTSRHSQCQHMAARLCAMQLLHNSATESTNCPCSDPWHWRDCSL